MYLYVRSWGHATNYGQTLLPASLINKYKYICLSTTADYSLVPGAVTITSASYWVDSTSTTYTISTTAIQTSTLNATSVMAIWAESSTVDIIFVVKLYN